MRVAIIYRPRSVAPIEVAPILMGALGQWVETHAERFSTLEFFVAGGGSPWPTSTIPVSCSGSWPSIPSPRTWMWISSR